MRFDDSLETVLAADMSSPLGVQSSWRQLVDLIGRRRVAATPEAIARLRSIRAQVPPPVRAASARALAFASPPAALVRLFAEDELSIAAPVLRIARLMPNEWVAMLPNMPSANRSILRHRRDLGPTVTRALETYGPSDFVLPPAELTPVMPVAAEIAPVEQPDEPVEAEQPADLTAVASADDQTGLASPYDDPAPSTDVDEVAAVAGPALADHPAIEDPFLSVDWQEVIAARPAIATEAPPERHAEPVTPAVPEQPAALSEPVPAPEPAPAPLTEQRPFRVSGSGFQIGAILAPHMTDVTTRAPASDVIPVAPLPEPMPETSPPPGADALIALAGVALGSVAVPELARRVMPLPPAPSEKIAPPAPEASPSEGTFQIADIVARIDAFQRERDEPDGLSVTEPELAEEDAPEHFRFETDARGVVRWVAGVERAALIGLSLDGAPAVGAQVDGMAAGAFRRRAGFANARLVIDGGSTAAGPWRISAIPVFDRATGRFTGYRGTGRRPRADESTEPRRQRTPGTDAVRQLVHELRTPTTAIVGFAEMIEGELLGPVPTAYRGYAGTIRQQARGLLGAIDDLDTAARLDSSALDLRPEQVALAPLLAGIVEDLRPLAALRRVQLTLFTEPGVKVAGDGRAVERLAGRLISTMVAAGSADETVMITAAAEGIDTVTLTVDRPQALGGFNGDALLSADADLGEDSGAPLLGTGFALRLVRNLAAELGGALVIGADRLTLRLPAAVTLGMEQATLS